MGWTDVLSQLLSFLGSRIGSGGSGQASLPSPNPNGPVVASAKREPTAEELDKVQDLIVPDIYPKDLGPNPNFRALVNKVVNGKRVVGCYLKATEGLGWGRQNELWYQRCRQQIRQVFGEEYGGTLFGGEYHFLRFSVDGARQAEYFHDQVQQAGGFDAGSLVPMVDVEEGGQGSWAPGKLETLDRATKIRLAADVTRVTTDFVRRLKELAPGVRVCVYGRGIFRDLEMTRCMFGADGVSNPAYTPTMPHMEQYGVPLDSIILWQANGDGEIHVPGYPFDIPNWGRTDYSIYVDGVRPTTLRSFRKRMLAFNR